MTSGQQDRCARRRRPQRHCRRHRGTDLRCLDAARGDRRRTCAVRSVDRVNRRRGSDRRGVPGVGCRAARRRRRRASCHLVRREQSYSAWTLTVSSGQPRCDPGTTVVALEPQYRAVIEEREDRRAERDDGMARIGEIKPALLVDDEIARLVVILAVEQRIDRDGPAIAGELDEAPATLLRAVERAVGTERQAVDAVGVA